MKKFLLLTLLAATIQLVQAQDYKKVQTNYLIGKFEDAKTEIDKVMADPKGPGKAESWYWKAKVYAAIYQNPVLRAKFPSIVKDADAAFTKYQEMEPSLELAKKNGPEGYFDMYKTSFGEAIKFFNGK